MAEIYRQPACPLHFGLGFNLECIDCRAMPTIMPNGELRDSNYAATTDHLRRWAKLEQQRMAMKGGKGGRLG